MLQITLEPQDQIVQNPSRKSNDWDFKLKVIREGDLTELRVCFEDSQDSGTTDNFNSVDGGQEGQNKTLL